MILEPEQIKIEEELFDELNEPTEQVDEEQEQDLFSEVETEQKAIDPSFDVNTMYTFVCSFTSMVAGIISAVTEKPAQRYDPPAIQKKNLAKSIIAAFPQIKMSPVVTLVISIILMYAPITLTAVNDFKEKKNATTAIDNNIRNERDRKNNVGQENTTTN